MQGDQSKAQKLQLNLVINHNSKSENCRAYTKQLDRLQTPGSMDESKHHQAESTAVQKKDGVYLLGARAFDIPWGRDYWKMPPPGSSIGVPAEQSSSLKWMEFSAAVRVEPGKKYAISFRIGFKADSYGYEDIPCFLMAKIGKTGLHTWKRLKQLEKQPRGPVVTPDSDDPYEIEVPASAPDPTIYFGVYEAWAWNAKYGLLLYDATVKEVEELKTED